MTFSRPSANQDEFGAAVASLGDLDGNGITDLAVGAPGDQAEGPARGAVWILYRAADGRVSSTEPIRPGDDAWSGVIEDGGRFGAALARVGDLDRDGIAELAVGAPGAGSGSVWILSLNTKGKVRHALRIGAGSGGFSGALDPGDRFGSALAALGDRNGDGRPELAVGAPGDDDARAESGALHILSLAADGVHSQRKISRTSGGFVGVSISEELGSSVALVGDVDGDGTVDLALGGPSSDVGGTDKGVVWILFLRPDDTIRDQQKLGSHVGLVPTFSNQRFGASLAPLGDLNGDSIPDLAVGAPLVGRGEVFAVLLNTDGRAKGTISIGSMINGARTDDRLGSSLASLGDLDGDGHPDITMGATGRDGPSRFLQDAIQAASDGDAVLVRSGSYDMDLSAKSLTVVADRGADVEVVDGPRIHDLAASQRVELRGLHFFAPPEDALSQHSPRPALIASKNDALVWLEDCECRGGVHFADPSAPGILVDRCADVVLMRIRSKGYSTEDQYCTFWSNLPGHGLLVQGGSTTVAYDCLFQGADGWLANLCGAEPFPTEGGAGVVSSSLGDRLFLSACQSIGGAGATYDERFGSSCSDGGPGLSSAGLTRVFDSHLQGGPGASQFGYPCSFDGPAQTGNLKQFLGKALRFSVNSPVREGEPVQLDFQGPPLSPVWLLSSSNPTSVLVPVLRGELLVDTPAIKLVGTTDVNGELHLTRTQPDLPQGVEFTTTFLQALYLEPGSGGGGRSSDRYVLGAASMLVALDRSF